MFGGVVGPCAWYPVQAAISDVGIRDRTWRTGTRRLRTVTAAGTAGDGQHTDNGAKPAGGPETRLSGLWLSWLLVVHILRPLGVALVLYWKQRAWRGQGAAVAGGTVGGR